MIEKKSQEIENSKQMMDILTNNDMIVTVLSFLSLKCQHSCSLISKQWHSAVQQIMNSVLNVESKGISAEGAKIISEMNNLTHLNMRGNRIKEEGLAGICKMINLTFLNVKCNTIELNDCKILRPMTQLTYLNLGCNRIRDLNHIHNLRKLTFLNIGSTGIKYISAISELKKLTHLIINGNKLNAEKAKLIGQLTELRFLDIGKNRIGDEGLLHIRSLTNLTTLNVRGNNLTNTVYLTKLDKLTDLNIGCNRFLDIRYLKGMKSLKTLNVSSCDLVFSEVLGFNQLVSLDFTGNTAPIIYERYWYRRRKHDLETRLRLFFQLAELESVIYNGVHLFRKKNKE